MHQSHLHYPPIWQWTFIVPLLASVSNAALNMAVQISVLGSTYPEAELLDPHVVTLAEPFQGLPYSAPQWPYHATFPLAMHNGSDVSTFSPTFAVNCLFLFQFGFYSFGAVVTLMCLKGYPIVLIYISVMASCTGHLFWHFLNTHITWLRGK